ncbi:MAG: hypothetical protein ACJAQT_000536 [Akkermansiaceae bacterium]|jgi:hypothetical protein
MEVGAFEKSSLVTKISSFVCAERALRMRRQAWRAVPARWVVTELSSQFSRRASVFRRDFQWP